MAQYTCQRARRRLDAIVTLPGSKSITNRALICAALAKGTSILEDVLIADDTRLMIDALGEFGIPITLDEPDCAVEITGCNGQLPATEAELFCGNSGTTIRFCAALSAIGRGSFRFEGVERMHQRPIGALTDILGSLGAGIEYQGEPGFPPLVVHAGGLSGGHVAFRSPPSSQHVSALMLAGPGVNGDLLIEVTGDVPSVPYLRMTTVVMESFGASVVEQYADRSAKFVIPAPQQYVATRFVVEPDASNATYFLAAAAVAGGRVTVLGLGDASVQGDVGFLQTLEQMGCRVTRGSDQMTVYGPDAGSSLRGIDVDLNDMPDTAQTLAVVALFADGPTSIRNVASLRLKETDRIKALACELTRLGALVETRDDGLTIHPPRHIQPAAIETYDDHRMAMSFAVAGLRADGITINDPDCCEKTFPGFFAAFEKTTIPDG